MHLKKADIKDVDAINTLYDKAKAQLRENGIDQWQNGYPNKTSAEEDIKTGGSYIISDQDSIAATAYIAAGTEPTYKEIHDGAWLSDTDRYIFIHRVAVNPVLNGRGYASMFFQEMEKIAKRENLNSLRCDTHRHNIAMQKTLEKNGFTKCGIIFLEDGSERFAFEKLL